MPGVALDPGFWGVCRLVVIGNLFSLHATCDVYRPPQAAAPKDPTCALSPCQLRLQAADARYLNASVEFDVATLRPTFRLLWGQAGESNALAVAQGLGFSPAIVKHAREIVQEGQVGSVLAADGLVSGQCAPYAHMCDEYILPSAYLMHTDSIGQEACNNCCTGAKIGTPCASSRRAWPHD